MSKVLIIDFETTGLDPRDCNVIECAYSLCDLQMNEIESMSILVSSVESVASEIEKLTGITSEILKYGYSIDYLKQCLECKINEARYIIAHNGNKYDFIILERLLGKQTHKIFIDTLTDLPVESKSLSYLCFDYGIYMQKKHRAIYDVQALVFLLQKLGFDNIIKYKQAPKAKIIANVSYNDRALASDVGFKWDNSLKHWFKICTEDKVSELTESLKFKFTIQILDN